MATIRDLKVRLGLEQRGFTAGMNKANKSVDSLAASSKALGALFAGGIVARGIGNLLGLAGDVSETMNLLEVTFKDSTDQVLKWAKEVSNATGLSEFELRDFAARLGDITLTMAGSVEGALKYSTVLSQLALDLSSLKNVDTVQAMEAIKSGLVGQAKPLQNLGIVMTQTTLQQFALAKGITQSVKAMSEAEKTQLRYEFLLSKTGTAQGDLEKTTFSYTNSIRAVKSQLKDLGTRIAMNLLPVAESFLKKTRKMIGDLQELNEEFGIFKPAAIGASTALGLFSAKLLIKFAPFLGKIGLLTAGFLALGLAIEDTIALFSGGESAIGSFIDKFAGVGESQKIVNALKKDWEAFLDAIPARIDLIVTKIGELLDMIKQIPILGKIASAFTGIANTGAEPSFPGEFQSPGGIIPGESFPGEFSRGNQQNNNNNANINVTVNAQTNADPQDIANMVEERIERHVTKAFDGTVVFAE